MEYYEKREYTEGIKYVPVTQFLPGHTYYVKSVDQNNQIFFSPIQTINNTSTAPSPYYPPPPNPYPPQQPYTTIQSPLLSNTTISREELDSARALHLGITITSIFIPTLIYLIGFPFCFVRLRDLAERASNPSVQERLRAYVGVGWTTWILHLAYLACACSFWVDQYCDYYYYLYFGVPSCYFGLTGLISMSVISFLTFSFSIAITVLGAVFVDSLLVTTIPSVGYTAYT